MNGHVRDNLSFLYTPPMCRVYNSANISVNDATVTALTFDSERFDTDTMHSTSSNTGRITATSAGKYILGFGGSLASAADYNFVQSRIRRAGTTNIAAQGMQHNVITIDPNWSLVTLWSFAAAEYGEAVVYQDNTAAAARNVEVVADRSPEFWASWVGN